MDDNVYGASYCLSFFFFKQKTAYEMRISDWSSDVCSSDLPVEEGVHHLAPAPEIVVGAPAAFGKPRHAALKAVAVNIAETRQPDRVARIAGRCVPFDRDDAAIGHTDPHARRPAAGKQCRLEQIGRAHV